MEAKSTKESDILVKKCIDEKLNKDIFYNYFEKLSRKTWNNNAMIQLPSNKLEVQQN